MSVKFPQFPNSFRVRQDLIRVSVSVGAREEEELYRCLVDNPLRDTNNKIIKCDKDEDCNREEGRELRDAKFWKYECVKSQSNEKHCCRGAGMLSFPILHLLSACLLMNYSAIVAL